jgi:2-dehydro-3-deoxygluconokinase
MHVSGISLAISGNACDTVFAAMQLAREAGTGVSFDANLRLKLWPLARARACITEVISMSDIFLPSLDDAISLCGLDQPDEIIDWGHALGAKAVVLKLGRGGALVSDGSRRERIAGHEVRLIDATGAGDCFSGNLLARMAQGASLFEAARYANAAGALAIQGFGAVAPLPRPDAVRALL